MRIADNGSGVTLWVSARETYDWAHRANDAWPCSTLSGHRICVTFDDNGMLDRTVDGRDPGDIDSHELSAICADMLRDRIDKDHPIYFVAVGQFEEG